MQRATLSLNGFFPIPVYYVVFNVVTRARLMVLCTRFLNKKFKKKTPEPSHGGHIGRVEHFSPKFGKLGITFRSKNHPTINRVDPTIY